MSVKRRIYGPTSNTAFNSSIPNPAAIAGYWWRNISIYLATAASVGLTKMLILVEYSTSTLYSNNKMVTNNIYRFLKLNRY